MSKQHEQWRFEIVTEIAELLAAKNVTVDDAYYILRQLILHADHHTGFVPFTPKLRDFVPIDRKEGKALSTAIPSSLAKATPPPHAMRKVPKR